MNRILIATVLGSLSLASCGDDTESSGGRSGETSQADRDAIEATVEGYYMATTVEDACARITLGLQTFIEGETDVPGDPASPTDARCEESIETAVGEGHFVLTATQVEIKHVAVDGDRAAASVVDPLTGEAPYPVYLVEGESGWLITAENFTPPGFEELGQEIGEITDNMAPHS